MTPHVAGSVSVLREWQQHARCFTCGSDRASVAAVGGYAHGLNASASAYSVRAAFASSNTNYSDSEATNASALTVNKASTSVGSITASASTFGGTTDLSATVTPHVAGSVAFFVNGSSTPVPATYDSSTGVATVSGYAHGLNASASAYSVRAAFASSNTNYSDSEATNASALTVNRAASGLAFDLSTLPAKTFGDGDFGVAS